MHVCMQRGGGLEQGDPPWPRPHLGSRKRLMSGANRARPAATSVLCSALASSEMVDPTLRHSAREKDAASAVACGNEVGQAPVLAR